MATLHWRHTRTEMGSIHTPRSCNVLTGRNPIANRDAGHRLGRRGYDWAVQSTLRPMPLVLVPGAFDHPDWLFELKHDGFRALAHVEGHRCTLVSRRRHVYTQFPMLLDEIAHSVRAMSCVLDGEIVCLASIIRGPFGWTIPSHELEQNSERKNVMSTQVPEPPIPKPPPTPRQTPPNPKPKPEPGMPPPDEMPGTGPKE